MLFRSLSQKVPFFYLASRKIGESTLPEKIGNYKWHRRSWLSCLLSIFIGQCEDAYFVLRPSILWAMCTKIMTWLVQHAYLPYIGRAWQFPHTAQLIERAAAKLETGGPLV